jgi:ketosteroid isomerase-like protein
MDDTAEPLATEHRFFRALAQGDSAELDRIMADDCVMIDLMRGAETPKAMLIQAVAGGLAKFGEITPIEARVRRYGNAAVVTGRTEMRVLMGDTPFAASSRYTHVYIEDGGHWRLVSAQGTQITE